MTNLEWIRAMSDEELADAIEENELSIENVNNSYCRYHCPYYNKCIVEHSCKQNDVCTTLEWLRAERESLS